MHILFIGYGKTSQRVAKQLFEYGYQITTISQTPKTDLYANHLIQDIHTLNLAQVNPINCVYILLSPYESGVEAYQKTYLDSVFPIIQALKQHPVQRVVVVSSTRVYGESHGQLVSDETKISPIDEQGSVLFDMEQAYLKAFPEKCTIVRPTGIYGTSIVRMVKLAEKTKNYPKIHWSNRIHIDDLTQFLVHLLHVEHLETSYICSNNRPIPLHEIIVWFQQQLNFPELILESHECSGKKVIANRMLGSGFKLKHIDCFSDYTQLLQAEN